MSEKGKNVCKWLLGFILLVILLVIVFFFGRYSGKEKEEIPRNTPAAVKSTNHEISKEVSITIFPTCTSIPIIPNTTENVFRELIETREVYVTRTGECYHYRSSCVQHPTPMPLGKAKEKFRPCSKCVH